MSILDANGAIACAECGRQAQAVRDRLKAENAKLREELAKWERLAAGIDLPEYPVTQFKPKDLERENAKLQDENDKLRELVRDMWHEGAFAPGACYVEAAERLEERTRELGIEVE